MMQQIPGPVELLPSRSAVTNGWAVSAPGASYAEGGVLPPVGATLGGLVALSRRNQHTVAWLARAATDAPPALRGALEERLALECQQEALTGRIMATHFGPRLVSCCPATDATGTAISEVTG
jgi:hypothetical protein